MPINTPFTLNNDKLAQLTASGAPIPTAVAPTYAAAIALTQIMANSLYVRVPGNSAVSATCSLTTAYLPTAYPGTECTICAAATGAGTVTYTFSTGFKASATAAPTTGTAITVRFVFDGSNWVEQSRSAAVTF